MLIKKNRPIQKIEEVKNKRSLSRVILLTIFTIFTFLILTVFLVSQNVQSIRDKSFELGFKAINQESIGSAIKRFPGAYLNKFLVTDNLQRIYIDIKFEDYQKLLDKKSKALSLKRIVQEEGDFVPAKIRLGERTYKTELRIKGDMLDHLIGNKWSFRIKTRKKDAFMGMRVFSIQNPYVRGFQGQSIIDKTRELYGLVSLRRELVRVTVNGNDIGIMEIEEHFSKELLESNGRKESVILRFDESDSWEYGEAFDFTNTNIDSFRQGTIESSINLKSHNQLAQGLLRSFANETLKPSEVFDTKEMGLFLAINRLWGAQHGVRWGNLRFFYNPYLGKLQPIGYDDNFHERKLYNQEITDKFFSTILEDAEIKENYLQSLELLVRDVLEGELIDKLKQFEYDYAKPLLSEFFLLEYYSYTDLVKRATWIQNNILKQARSDDFRIPKLAHVFYIKQQEENKSDLQIMPALPAETSLIDIIHPDIAKQAILKNKIQSKLPIVIPAKGGKPKESIIIRDLPTSVLMEAEYVFSLTNTEHTSNQSSIESHYSLEKSVIEKDVNLQNFIDMGLLSKESNNKIYINEGSWNLRDSLVIKGFNEVKLRGNIELNFQNNAGLLIDGNINTIDLIRLTSNGNGESGWIYILNNRKQVRLEGVELNNVGPVILGDINLTGAFSIYNSNIDIYDLSIKDIRSEDALNFISSEFLLNNCLIENSDSDAIDVDFSEGSIKGCSFINIGTLGGGDAVDTSGSEVLLSDSSFSYISDKAVSSGEGSRTIIENITVQNSTVGVASKDGSYATVKNSFISDSTLSHLMAYIKKPEYGPAKIDAFGTQFNGDSNFISQRGSEIFIDAVLQDSEEIDIDNLYKTLMKPGLK